LSLPCLLLSLSHNRWSQGLTNKCKS
jgi:hypothetical protein